MSGTGEGKRHLIQGIRYDLTRIRRQCESLSQECEQIHDDSKGLSGWPAVWKGVSQLLAQAAAQLREAERSDLPRLRGNLSARIITEVNPAQVDAVRSFRDLDSGTDAETDQLPLEEPDGRPLGGEHDEPSEPFEAARNGHGPAPSTNGNGASPHPRPERAAPSNGGGPGRNGMTRLLSP